MTALVLSARMSANRVRRTRFPNNSADTAAMPMSEMNTTPLIDVMLVLLIMFIITVPMATHSVKLDLPAPGPQPLVRPLANELTIDQSGATRWNGDAVSRAGLRALLAASAAMPKEPELHLAPDADAPFAVVDSILADAKRAGVHRMGFVGNANYARVF